MISWLNILQLLGVFVFGVTLSMLVPLGMAWWTGDPGLGPLLRTVALGAVASAASLVLPRGQREINRREGILFVVLAWVVASALGALPFELSGHFPTYADAFFESISGFTTTGASVLSDVEALPASLLLWRAMTQWIGGMGIIVLAIAVLPLLGTGGMELYRAEFSGAKSERLKPRIAETAAALWKIYVAFTLALYVALRFAGMPAFDAVCHSMTTMATGGFSVRNASIGAYQSPAIEGVVIIFMLIAGINFTQHYRLIVQREARSFFGDYELRAYALIAAAAALAIAVSLQQFPGHPAGEAFRLSLFQVASIMTTTGFASADYEAWSPFCQLVLLALMFVGGCTGSTAGGMKASRVALLFHVVRREFRRMVERRGVFAVRLSGRAVSEPAISSLLNLVYLALLVNFAACLLLTFVGVDVVTSISAVASAMFNIGPALGEAGPTDNYGAMPNAAKWVLSFCMLAGRLEFYTVLVLLAPAFWRK